jgi:hypothetical protein
MGVRVLGVIVGVLGVGVGRNFSFRQGVSLGSAGFLDGVKVSI